jgi:phospholipid/cholesterol/gamma-HCH transport system ATP-binding protein
MAEREDELDPNKSLDANDGRVADEAKRAPVVHMDLSLAGLMDEEIFKEPAPAVEGFMAEAAVANEADAEIIEVKEERVPYISFENVCKSFGSFVVLKDVNFYVYPGETLCILGRSGVGKSVSLQMLMGFLKPDKGTIRVAG